MHLFFFVATGLSLALVVRAIVRAGPLVRNSTLTTARSWGAVALSLWCAACLAELVPDIASSRLRDQLWYAVALISLCPLLAALGARRPGHRVWTLFVLIPMLAVLGWPAVTVWFMSDTARLQLEAPTLVGFGIVLVMSAGNYLGTRFLLAASLLAVSLVLVVTPLSAGMDASPTSPDPWRLAATILLGLAAGEAVRKMHDMQTAPRGWNRVWGDFRDLFGIVWANRLEERLRQTARQERWALTPGPRGFEPLSAEGLLSPEQTAQRQDHTLRWLLRRFVDAEWIDSRL